MPTSLYARLRRKYHPPVDGPSRRELLRASLAAGASLLLSNCVSPPRPGRHTPRVIIIGAGFAGLACGHELCAAGCDARVVEARNRLGGRVLSFHDLVPGKNVEGGGELVGTNHPTWVAYADRFGLEFLPVTDDASLDPPILLDGRRLDDATARALLEEMDAALNQMCRDAAPVDADRPWLSPDAPSLDHRPTSAWLDSLTCSPLCKRAIATFLTADNGVPIDRQSYLGNLALVKGGGLERFWTDSETLRCKGGNQQLAHKLAAAIGHDRISLSTPVQSITLRDHRAHVTTAAGATLEADHVVLAVPPSVWPEIRITPALPAHLTPQMGTTIKHLLALRGPFWRTRNLAPDSLSDTDVQLTWHSTDAQPGPGGDAMVCFSSAAAADRLRALTPADRTAHTLRLIDRLYPDCHARDHLTATRFMDWPSTPWTRAGYSFPAPGQITSQGPTLHAGLGPLHFAGEHTCYAFVGYMEGALHSGASLARRLAAQHNLLR